MSRQRTSLVVVGLLVTVVVVAAVSSAGSRLLARQPSAAKPASCRQTGQNHAVTISGNQLKPVTVSAKLCDTLSIKNLDAITREIGFGPHDHHVAYDGVAQEVLTHGQSLTITLNRPGTYFFHDHFHDEIAGSFTVTR